MSKEGNKRNLKAMMQLMRISYQNVSDHSGVSKADVCRVMDSDMEEKVIEVVVKLIKERKKNADDAVAPYER
jgi:hypothetical protein